MTRRSSLVVTLFFACVAVTSGCDRSTPKAGHEALSNIEPLRLVFNADSGKVRAIFLASPT